MATKLHVSRKQLEYYAILMVLASGKGGSLSAARAATDAIVA